MTRRGPGRPPTPGSSRAPGTVLSNAIHRFGFWGRWGLVFLVWTLVSLLVATQALFRFRQGDAPVSWPRLAAFQLLYWYGWALWTPLVFHVAARFPLTRERWGRRLLLHATTATLVSIVMMGWWSLLMIRVAGEGGPFGEVFRRYLAIGFHYDFLTYAAILFTGLALSYRSLYRERSLRASQLETRLAQAQLDVLRMQLRPHFLFNTLHAIASLVESDAPGARRMIARLSSLLRRTLDLEGRQEVPLREELEILGDYLEIEECRFQDRLRVEHRVEAECLEALVPAFVLQPLVENAVRHGIEERDGACRIEVGARRQGDALELSVRDHGPGMSFEDPSAPEGGIGIANVRTRLEQMYPRQGRLALERPEGGGLRAVVRLPFSRGDRGAGT